MDGAIYSARKNDEKWKTKKLEYIPWRSFASENREIHKYSRWLTEEFDLVWLHIPAIRVVSFQF